MRIPLITDPPYRPSLPCPYCPLRPRGFRHLYAQFTTAYFAIRITIVDSHYEIMRQLYIGVYTVSQPAWILRGNQTDKHDSR